MPTLYKSFPVAGVEQDGDDLRVVGKCSDGQIDHDGDIVSPAWMAQAVRDFIAGYPAVRLQHRQDYPVGKGLEAWQDSDGSTWLKSLIVDKQAKKMVKSGVLAAYSVGIAEPITKQSPRARRYEIVGGRLAEVSLVDSPSNARCGIQVVAKSAGGNLEYVGRAWKASKPDKILKRAVAAERDDIAAWVDSPDPLLREQARAFLASSRAGDPAGVGRVKKSGKGKVTKRRLDAIGQAVAEEMVFGVYLDSADPFVREQARKAVESGGLRF